MARRVRVTSAAAGTADPVLPLPGSVRTCEVYRGEVARHRLITADGLDYVVATADERRQGRGFVTSALPVVRGYLVMMRQPLCALTSMSEEAARNQHTLLVNVLVEGGTRVVKARRNSAAWRRAERMVEAGATVTAAPADTAAEEPVVVAASVSQ
jgi:hypothetical protein